MRPRKHTSPNLYECALEIRPDSRTGVCSGMVEPTAVGLLASREATFVVVVGGATLLLCLFLLYSGLYAIRGGFNQYRRSARIRNTPTEEAGSLAMGRTELYGEVRPAGETLDQPFADGECVWMEWEVEGYSNGENRSGWGLVERDVAGISFDLDDGTGRVRVTDPRAAFDGNFESRWPFLLSDERETSRVVGPDDPVPDPVRAFCEARGIDVRGGSKRRFTQTVIDVESETYAYGEAGRRDDPAPREPEVELRPEATTGDFILSDTPPSELSGAFRKGMGQGIGVGLVVGILGLGGLWLWYQNFGPSLWEFLVLV